MNLTIRLSWISTAVVLTFSAATVTAQVGVEHQKLLASDGSGGDAFGYSGALEGDTAVIGADQEGNRGAAYVFTREPDGSWVQLQKLTASNGGPGYEFGHSVAISGDWIAVGSRLEDAVGPDVGAVYMFRKQGSTYTQTQIVRANDYANYDHFGTVVEMDGNRMVVASPRDDDGGNNSGAAYVFEESGGTWSQTAKLLPSAVVSWDLVPHAISLDGNRLVLTSVADQNLTGIAYVYDLQGGTWNLTKTLTASDKQQGDEYGTSVALDGDYLLIGARLDGDSGTYSGAAYAYQRSGSNWTETQKFNGNDTVAHDHFGWAMDMDGTRALISANRANPQGIATAGKSYLFERLNNGNWVEVAQMNVTDPSSGDFQGWASDLDGHRILVTANGDNQKGSDAGAAYIAETDFLRSTDGISATNGGTIDFHINLGVGEAGTEYWVMGSYSGIFPGTPWTIQVPLNWDLYFRWTLSRANLPPLVNSRGLLDSRGSATFSLTAPANLGPSFVGFEMQHAALTYDSATGTFFTGSSMPTSFVFKP